MDKFNNIQDNEMRNKNLENLVKVYLFGYDANTTDEMFQEVKDFAQFLAQKNK